MGFVGSAKLHFTSKQRSSLLNDSFLPYFLGFPRLSPRSGDIATLMSSQGPTSGLASKRQMLLDPFLSFRGGGPHKYGHVDG